MSAPATKEESFKHVKYLWRDEEASKLFGVDRLVYRSNKLGEDLTLTNTGGGNMAERSLAYWLTVQKMRDGKRRCLAAPSVVPAAVFPS